MVCCAAFGYPEHLKLQSQQPHDLAHTCNIINALLSQRQRDAAHHSQFEDHFQRMRSDLNVSEQSRDRLRAQLDAKHREFSSLQAQVRITCHINMVHITSIVEQGYVSCNQEQVWQDVIVLPCCPASTADRDSNSMQAGQANSGKHGMVCIHDRIRRARKHGLRTATSAGLRYHLGGLARKTGYTRRGQMQYLRIVLNWPLAKDQCFSGHVVWPGLKVVSGSLLAAVVLLPDLQLCEAHYISTVLQLLVIANTPTAPGTAASLQH